MRRRFSTTLAALWLIALAVPDDMARSGVPGDAGSDDAASNCATVENPAGPETSPRPFSELLAEDRPLAWWRLTGEDVSSAGGGFAGMTVGDVALGSVGPRPERFPGFDADNTAAWFTGDGGRIVVKDVADGDERPLQFRQGDAITLEAWVGPTTLSDGQNMYVVGKGRTRNPGYPAENQNYALRLTGVGGEARVSFLFRDVDDRDAARDWHRWTSSAGFRPGDGWHHVAVCYEFGRPDSIRGYLDGRPVKGKWDYGGASAEAPVVDGDELWIGSSMGGNAGSSFRGGVDEVAIHRRILPPERIAARYRVIEPPSYTTPPELFAARRVLVEVFHGIPDGYTWKFPMPEPFERYTQAEWALPELPRHYNAHGVRADRGNPVVVRLTGRYVFPPGEHRLLVRSRSAARVHLDGTLVVENTFPTRGGDGHGPLYDVVSRVSPHIRPPRPGDDENETTITGTGEPRTLSVDVYLGGRKRRPETGEMCLALGDAAGHFQVLTFDSPIPLTDAGWEDWSDARRAEIAAMNAKRRRAASQIYAAYWDRRHEAARKRLAARPPVEVPAAPEGLPANNAVDAFLNVKLAESGVEPLPLTDDFAFLRRACLDVIGTIPTPEINEAFFADPPEERRGKLVDGLLEHPGWADHWVGYWQDVLAENPNLVNPTLNNTGPFRWWLHESFLDNKPLDRFATELILMEGSENDGGPAGFGLASQNDSPTAAKAYVLAQAFLGMEMKCARCHDAPYHEFTQRDLFSLAAMLKRAPESVPKTSTVPPDSSLASGLVKVTLKPGEPVAPEWPFAEEIPAAFPDELLERPGDTRERLAAAITSPDNPRFGQVVANRMWKRYLGRGLVEPVDDWNGQEPSHPELLDFLERELVASGYDLKYVTRLILTSHAYQRRQDAGAVADAERASLLAGSTPRRMSAEQVVDSLFTAAGKPFRTEELNIDVDGLRSEEQSRSFGHPARAWQFIGTSNERDRPSLSLPASQTILDVLEPFGWRPTRPDPLSERPQEASPLQPAILANGVVGRRISQFSDGGRFTELALRDVPVEAFVDAVYRATLTRPPSADELRLMTDLLAEGYEDRRRPDQPSDPPRRPRPTGVSWTNHLQPEANEIKLAFAAEVEKGDPPTRRLAPDWRERAEDVVWALINSPEFVFVP